MRSCSDVHNRLTELDVAHEVIQVPSLSSTARQAADALGVRLEEIVKSLVFLLDGTPTLVLVPGHRVADRDRLKAVTGAAKVALAKGEAVLDVTGYRIGAVPPVALETALPAIVDPAVFQPAIVYCGGGSETTMIKIRSDDLRNVLGAQVAEIGVAPAGR